MLDAIEREIGNVQETIDAGFELDECAEALEFHDLALVTRARRELLSRDAPGIFDERFPAEPNLAALVDLQDFHVEAVAVLEVLEEVRLRIVRRLGNVNEPFDVFGFGQRDEDAPLDHRTNDA